MIATVSSNSIKELSPWPENKGTVPPKVVMPISILQVEPPAKYSHGIAIANKQTLHKAYTVTFIEQPCFHSLNNCEEK